MTPEPEEDEWVPTYEKAGPVCPFGHPWGATERIAELEEAIAVLERRLAAQPYETERELAVRVEDLERQLAEKDEALRGVGWHDKDGLCWCDEPAEITKLPHSAKCIRAREALRAEPATGENEAA